MMKSKLVFVIIFFGLLALPLLFFKHGSNIESAMDMRMLAEAPQVCFGSEEFADELEWYLSDRSGFRDESVSLLQSADRTFFNDLSHPLYEYGKGGEAFLVRQCGYGDEMTEYLDEFADMVIAINEYCRVRNCPFIFVFDPLKNNIYREELPAGETFENDWLEIFMDKLDAAGVHCVNNADTMLELKNSGVRVFNRLYDVGHWNATGAYYGVEAVVEALNEEGFDIQQLKENDFEVEYDTPEYLPSSLIKNTEEIVQYVPKNPAQRSHAEYYGNINMDGAWQEFEYKEQSVSGSGHMKLLAFQGSYFNGTARPFMESVIPEYITVQAYQNVTDFEYYYELFEPEAVLFEMAEYTFEETYFSQRRIEALLERMK